MRVLVTGGAGYIGSVIVERLVARGDEVTVLDDLSAGHREAVSDGATLVEGDLLDRGAVERALSGGCEAVMHFAAKALVSESMREPELYWRVNAVGSHTLLSAMRAARVTRFLHSSTCAVYGEPGAMPISEETPTRPVNPYGASKLAVDHMAAAWAATYGFATISLRYFNVAGASERFGEVHDPETHLVPLALRAAGEEGAALEVKGTDFPTDDGTAVRDYVHVEDLAEAHLLGLEAFRPGEHRTFNVGSGTGYSVRDVVAAIESTLGAEVNAVDSERRPGDPAVLVASAERIEAELGWRPKRDLGEMIRSAWRFMRDHPDGYH